MQKVTREANRITGHLYMEYQDEFMDERFIFFMLGIFCLPISAVIVGIAVHILLPIVNFVDAFREFLAQYNAEREK